MSTTTKENNEIYKDLAAMKEDFSKLRSDVSDLVGTLMDSGRGKIHDAGDAVAETAKHAKEVSKDSVEHFGEKIKERPLTSVGIAVGAGFLIGRLLRG